MIPAYHVFCVGNRKKCLYTDDKNTAIRQSIDWQKIGFRVVIEKWNQITRQYETM